MVADTWHFRALPGGVLHAEVLHAFARERLPHATKRFKKESFGTQAWQKVAPYSEAAPHRGVRRDTTI
jgi:hypothetical protein